MRDDRERLRDILEATANILKYAERGKKAFESDELIQNWMLRHLQIIGEAASKITGSTQEKASSIPWKKIIGMRHILVHNYFGIDTAIVWRAITKDVPALARKVRKLLGSMEKKNPA